MLPSADDDPMTRCSCTHLTTFTVLGDLADYVMVSACVGPYLYIALYPTLSPLLTRRVRVFVWVRNSGVLSDAVQSRIPCRRRLQ